MDLYISQDKICTEFVCGARVLEHPLLVRQSEEFTPLWDHTVTGDDAEKVTIFIRRWYGWSEMVLPSQYTFGLSYFLKHFHQAPRLEFDCYSFATIAAGLPLHDKKYLRAFWQTRSLNQRVIAGHKIVFLTDEKNNHFAHAALHIGSGYFLSVQGAGGELSVSILEDLRVMYQDFPDIVEAVPRDEADFQGFPTTSINI